MPRRRKVPLVKGPKRIRYLKSGDVEIVQSLFCGECGKKTQAATIQVGRERAKREGIKRTEEVARVCTNVEKHKTGNKYFWPLKKVEMPIY